MVSFQIKTTNGNKISEIIAPHVLFWSVFGTRRSYWRWSWFNEGFSLLVWGLLLGERSCCYDYAGFTGGLANYKVRLVYKDDLSLLNIRLHKTYVKLYVSYKTHLQSSNDPVPSPLLAHAYTVCKLGSCRLDSCYWIVIYCLFIFFRKLCCLSTHKECLILFITNQFVIS